MNYENDIPLSAAIAAHSGTSFVPEQRGAQMRREYSEQLAADYESLSRLATTPEKQETLAEEFERYRAGFRQHYLAWLHSRSRVISVMITGGSNFPTERNRKRNDSADRRCTELLEFRARALKAIERALCPERAPIMSGDADAAERLREKIAAAEAEHDLMKRVNRAHERYLKDPASLDAVDLPEEAKIQIRTYKPAYSWEPHPFAPYQISNNGANIRRMKERLAQIEQAKATPATEAHGAAARLEDCPPENRVRLFFPGKPAAEIRERLKRGGFRWAPTIGAWQAYRNEGTLALAKEIAIVV